MVKNACVKVLVKCGISTAMATVAVQAVCEELYHHQYHLTKEEAIERDLSLVECSRKQPSQPEKVSRLQIAGIQSVASSKQGYCMSVETNHDVDSVVDKVLEKIKGLAVGIPEGAQAPPSVEFVDNKPVGRFTNRERRPYRSRLRSFRGGYQPTTSKTRRCRACQSADHYVRECPVRFCQACGNKGHDSWDKSCPKYL